MSDSFLFHNLIIPLNTHITIATKDSGKGVGVGTAATLWAGGWGAAGGVVADHWRRRVAANCQNADPNSSAAIAHLIKSNQTLFATCAEYNKCRLYCEMLTNMPLTNSAVQEEENIYQVG